MTAVATVSRRPAWGPLTVAIPILVAVVVRGWSGFEDDQVQVWSTLFVSICIQSLPFLVLGVTISGLIAAWVSPEVVARLVPRRRAVAVPVAGLAGAALPGCECGSVPIAGRLIASGTEPAAALTFLLAAPAINPVVLVATAVAFPHQPSIVIARFTASLLAAIGVGTWWARRGDVALLDRATHAHDHGDAGRWHRFSQAAAGDLLHAGGYLVLGGAAAATVQLAVPGTVLEHLGGNEVASVAVMAALAVLLSVCSEADAFVATGLPQFSLTSRLVFLVVGPVLDLKLFAMQVGVFGRAFALRFAPVSLAIAVASAVVVGQVLL